MNSTDRKLLGLGTILLGCTIVNPQGTKKAIKAVGKAVAEYHRTHGPKLTINHTITRDIPHTEVKTEKLGLIRTKLRGFAKSLKEFWVWIY